MFSSVPSVFDLSLFRCHLGLMFFGGRWSDGERSEPSSTVRQRTSILVRASRLSQSTRSYGKRFPRLSVFAFLAHARNDADIPAQGTSAVRASSFSPRMAFGQSVAQLEPRALRDPNSNRCLSGGSGRKLACIRMSQNIVKVR